MQSVCSVLTLMLCSTVAGAETYQYECVSAESCFSSTGCEPQEVASKVSVDELQGTIHYGSDAVFDLQEKSPRTVHVGFARPSRDHQHGSFVLYENMQFLLTANVFVEGFEGDQGAMGFVVRGNCERVTS